VLLQFVNEGFHANVIEDNTIGIHALDGIRIRKPGIPKPWQSPKMLRFNLLPCGCSGVWLASHLRVKVK
jgi:hypothetical protein